MRWSDGGYGDGGGEKLPATVTLEETRWCARRSCDGYGDGAMVATGDVGGEELPATVTLEVEAAAE